MRDARYFLEEEEEEVQEDLEEGFHPFSPPQFGLNGVPFEVLKCPICHPEDCDLEELG